MNSRKPAPTMRSGALRSPGRRKADATQDQLFSYAQDLHDLMDAYGRLQRRYQTVLESHGRIDQNADVLLDVIQRSFGLHLVTDSQGVITDACAEAQERLMPVGVDLKGQGIWQLMPESERASISALLKGFVGVGPTGAAVLRKFVLASGSHQAAPLVYDVLVTPLRRLVGFEVHWTLEPEQPGAFDAIQVLESFLTVAKCDKGVIITDADGRIRTVNPAFVRITGYSKSEVVGQNPRLLSSGRQDADFYRGFWAHLIDSGTWTGDFFNRRKSGHIFTDWKTVKAVRNDEGETIAYVSAFSDISSRVSDTEQLTSMAYHDALTGLPNRRLLQDRMAQAMTKVSQDRAGLCVLYLDLNAFKPVNDRFGHAAGDEVLKEVGARMKSAVRSSDTVARVGGDEFVVLLESPVGDEDAYSVASAMLRAIRSPIEADGHSHRISASIGCARYPKDGDTPEELLRNADSAMYAAKRFGIDFSVYDTGVDANPNADLGYDVCKALSRGEMYLLYQPQISASGSRQVRGCEALLRWHHSVLGEVAPSTFIPIAENNGAIIGLGQWVMATACAQLRQWQEAGLNDLTMCINVSARELQDPDFSSRVRQVLSETGVDPARLELEFNETDAMLFLADDRSCLNSLSGLGVRIAIDDFNVGHAGSLARLKSLPISRLMIDRKFVRDLALSSDASAISHCFIDIGKTMGMEVIACGVETAEQLEVLAQQGCHLVQGFYTGRPMRADELFALARGVSRTDALANLPHPGQDSATA